MDESRRLAVILAGSAATGVISAAVYGLTGWRLFEVISIACATACLLCIGYVLGKDE